MNRSANQTLQYFAPTSEFPSPGHRRAFVVLNEQSGNADLEKVRAALGRQFPEPCTFHTLSEGDDVAAVVRRALANGHDLIVAAGGDGTVSAVVDGLVGSDATLGIIPAGTGNALAQELGIPLDLAAACSLLGGDHTSRLIDALQVGDQYFCLHVGVGVESLTLKHTNDTLKRRLGSLAYVVTAVRQIARWRPRRFTLTVDGRPHRESASEIVVANAGGVGVLGLVWGPHIRLDDAVADVSIVRARTWLDYARVAWALLRGRQQPSPKMGFLRAQQSIAIASSRPLPIHGDGELIGETPLSATIIPAAVRVAVPRPTTQ